MNDRVFESRHSDQQIRRFHIHPRQCPGVQMNGPGPVDTYTRRADRKRLAREAMGLVVSKESG